MGKVARIFLKIADGALVVQNFRPEELVDTTIQQMTWEGLKMLKYRTSRGWKLNRSIRFAFQTILWMCQIASNMNRGMRKIMYLYLKLGKGWKGSGFWKRLHYSILLKCNIHRFEFPSRVHEHYGSTIDLPFNTCNIDSTFNIYLLPR